MKLFLFAPLLGAALAVVSPDMSCGGTKGYTCPVGDIFFS
jgi:hypothetical protein